MHPQGHPRPQGLSFWREGGVLGSPSGSPGKSGRRGEHKEGQEVSLGASAGVSTSARTSGRYRGDIEGDAPPAASAELAAMGKAQLIRDATALGVEHREKIDQVLADGADEDALRAILAAAAAEPDRFEAMDLAQLSREAVGLDDRPAEVDAAFAALDSLPVCLCTSMNLLRDARFFKGLLKGSKKIFQALEMRTLQL